METERFYRIPSELGEVIEIGFVYDAPALLYRIPSEESSRIELWIESPYASLLVQGNDRAAVEEGLRRLNAMVLRCRRTIYH